MNLVLFETGASGFMRCVCPRHRSLQTLAQRQRGEGGERRSCEPGEGLSQIRSKCPSPRRFAATLSPQVRGERLSCKSSGLPWPVIPKDGVEHRQKLSGDRDESL